MLRLFEYTIDPQPTLSNWYDFSESAETMQEDQSVREALCNLLLNGTSREKMFAAEHLIKYQQLLPDVWNFIRTAAREEPEIAVYLLSMIHRFNYSISSAQPQLIALFNDEKISRDVRKTVLPLLISSYESFTERIKFMNSLLVHRESWVRIAGEKAMSEALNYHMRMAS